MMAYQTQASGVETLPSLHPAITLSATGNRSIALYVMLCAQRPFYIGQGKVCSRTASGRFDNERGRSVPHTWRIDFSQFRSLLNSHRPWLSFVEDLI